MFIKANSNAKVEETDISTHLPQEFWIVKLHVEICKIKTFTMQNI